MPVGARDPATVRGAVVAALGGDGWRGCGAIPLGETVVVLLLILFARIFGTICEEQFGSSRYAPRRRSVQDLLNLMFRGPLAFRMLCLGSLLAQVFIFPSEVRSPARLFFRLPACSPFD